MSALLIGADADLVELGEIFTRLTEKHQERMAAVGLSA